MFKLKGVSYLILQSNGYLRPGELLSNIDELFNTFVIGNRFNNSKIRIKHFQQILILLKKLNELNLVDGITHIVVDGSFCSSKLEPNDIDVFIYYDAASEKHYELERFMDLNRVKIKNNGIHIVTFIDFSNLSEIEIDSNKRRLDELSRRQFERYYKMSRENIEKGYLILLKENLLLGGERYVSTIIEPTQGSTR